MTQSPINVCTSLTILGLGLVVYSSLGVFIDLRGQSDPALVSQLCHYLMCAENLQMQHAFGQAWSGQLESRQVAETVRQAVVRNSAYPYRWCDLGDALLESGQVEGARYSFERAAALGPHVPPVLLRQANFYFRIADTQRALTAMSGVLRGTGEFDDIIFDSYRRLEINTNDVLRYGMPAEPRAARAYFRWAQSTLSVSAMRLVWSWMIARAIAEDRSAAGFVDLLLSRHLYEDAAQAWADYVGPRQPDYRKPNLVFNGSFENVSGGSIFDWRVASIPGVEVERDQAVSRTGNGSLRIHFDGKENRDYHHISQSIVASPGVYEFRAEIRAEGLTTDQGIAFRIVDAEAPSRLDIITAQAMGTTEWITVNQRVLVPHQTRILQIQVVRRPSVKFDNLLAGTVWIDEVRLTAVR
jgi:hypothetical protein